MGRARISVTFVAAALVVLALGGCTQAAPKAHASATRTSTAATASPTPTPTAKPVYLPTGTALANKPYFDQVNSDFFVTNGSAQGRAIIDNLVAAGFTKADMQVTPDRTSIGAGADSILFAVKIGPSCLLGQHGGGGYSSSVQAALTTGGPCLLGLTRQINW
jgi:hypothetical protein